MEEQVTGKTEVVNMMFAHHHLGDVLDMVAAGKTVIFVHGTKKKVMAVVRPPTQEEIDAARNNQ